MEEIALSLVGPIVSPIFTKLQNAALPYFGGDITEEELQHLQNTILPKIRAVLRVAEAKNMPELQPWLVTLKEAAYEAEDVLDMYEYKRLKDQVRSVSTSIKKLKEKAKAAAAPFTLKTELKNTMEKLNKVSDGIDKFTSIVSNLPNQDPMNQQQPSVSSPTSLVIGRDHEGDSIVNMLISAAKEPTTSSGSRIPVLAIYGIGGAGKTTLAQSINKDPRVEKHFDTKTYWVHVSRKFDARAITRQIIESITEGECPRVEGLDALQKKLKKLLLGSKKFLLVLDDVWCLDKERWDQMLIPFNEVGETGSRILITCRAKEVASKLGVDHSFPLAELEDGDFWSIFKHYAFGDAKKDITDPQLSELASEIVKKLSKSPLAARMVGSSLRGQEVGYWKQTLQRGDMLKDTLGALYWSFEMLPSCLQRCFALCSLYPKGSYFESIEENFVRLWIAQGFIEVPSNSTVTLEDEARSYFNELLSKSFFQKKYGWYEMHDLLHDLAEDVSKDYCFRVENGHQHIPENVMHLSVVGYKNISSHRSDIFKLVNLRTLIIVSRSIELDDISGFIQQVFMKFKKLRMLHLGGGIFDKGMKLDKSVGGLKLLRYLQVRAVEELPESLGKLYHLQFLVIDRSTMNKVPQELNKLINLRYMGGLQDRFNLISGHDITASKIPYFGKLTSLQAIGRYEVSSKEKQFGIGQLKNLQQLRGTLCIDGLENVKDKAEASEASLKEKEHVDRLELHWKRQSSGLDGSMDEEVLEGLQPHPNLGALKLDSYNGVRLPKWTREDGSLSSSDLYFIDLGRLHSLEIVDCDNLQQVPSLPGLLGRLVIKGCENLSELPLLPLGLKVLDLEHCGDGVQGVGFDLERGLKVLTSLTHLTLTELPWLTSLLLGPNLTALEDVRIEDCGNLRSIGNSLVSSSSLKSLRITNCPRLTVQQQQQGDDHWGGGVIDELYVTGCPELTWLWNLNCFTSVRKLRVERCPKLTLIKSGGGGGGGDDSLSPMPSSLLRRVMERLYVEGCPELTWLWNLNFFTSVRELWVRGCSKLTLIKSGGGGGGDDSLSPMPSSSSSALESVAIDDLSLLTAALLPPRRRESLCCLNSLRILTIPFTAEQEELFQHHLTSLTFLRLHRCWGLPSLPANLENLSSLRELHIEGCLKIESLPNLPASLTELHIFFCPKIESLPNLPASLRELSIGACPKIESLPNLPASLERVSIRGGCHPRLKEKYGNDEKFRFRG